MQYSSSPGEQDSQNKRTKTRSVDVLCNSECGLHVLDMVSWYTSATRSGDPVCPHLSRTSITYAYTYGIRNDRETRTLTKVPKKTGKLSYLCPPTAVEHDLSIPFTLNSM